MIISPKILLLLIVIVLIGYIIVHCIANRKWGYTKKREAELSRQPEWDANTSSRGLRCLFHKKKE